ncbi:MAG: hypothetical protein J5803_00650 [Desulfovibrio sp.]|nr:hypothetical protein [Desulfovibrio sp.]
MEKLLTRLAHQLDSLDEASLLLLWNKYANIASRFEPTQRWEEAVLVFAMIQAKHWKNQLFNYNFAKMSKPSANADKLTEEQKKAMSFGFSLEMPKKPKEKATSQCHVLSFRKSPEGEQDGRSESKSPNKDTSPEE